MYVEHNLLLQCMMGGAWFEELFGDTQDTSHFEEVAIEGLAKQLGIKTKPYRTKTTIHKVCQVCHLAQKN